MTSTLDRAVIREHPDAVWVAVCRVADLQRERAVCAIVGGLQVAVVRTFEDELYAVSQRDPISGAFVLSRGIVGTRRQGDLDVPVLQSPLFKQAYDLRTGSCLEDAAVVVPVFPIRARDGLVQVATRAEARHG